MPELPEVEHLRRTLAQSLTGRRITQARLLRRDMLVRESDPQGGFSRTASRPATKAVPPRELLSQQRITNLVRRGKQLALVCDSGRVLCVHLGMSGQLLHLPARTPPPNPNHIHAVWTLDDASRLLYRDPRRFGGVWAYSDVETLQAQRWASLGPDALTITPRILHQRLACTKRMIKAALLDQSLIAGVGNIYADEALFHARVNPTLRALDLTPEQTALLTAAITRVLRASIKAGGSTIRDYTDPSGAPGGFQSRHHVYARLAQPCTRCRTPLIGATIAQRSTVWCPRCQR